MTSAKLKHIQAHYERRVGVERDSFDILDWGSAADQQTRFEILLRVLTGEHPRAKDGNGLSLSPVANSAESKAQGNETLEAPLSILDVGCGLTDLCTFLRERQVQCRYFGVDITTAILGEAHRRWSERALLQADVFAAAPFSPKSFDVVFCSGIFNLKVGNNESFASHAIPQLASLANHCVVANFLHMRTPRKYPHCFYFDPDKLAEIASRNSSQVDIVDNYLENDFTLIVWP